MSDPYFSTHTGAVLDTVLDNAADVTSPIQAQLNGKAPTVHTHAEADITNLASDLAGKAASSHTHPATQIGSGAVDNTEFGYLDGVTSGIQGQLNGKAASSHTHAEADVTNLVTDLASKADGAVTATALAGKLATANDLSEINTTTKRTNARGNLDVLWADDTRGLLVTRSPRGGLQLTLSATYKITGTSAVPFGLSDFSISAAIRMDDYTPSATAIIWVNSTSINVRLVMTTAGVFQLIFNTTGSDVIYSMTPDVALIDGEAYLVTVSVVRSGLATLYINGISDRDKSGAGVSVSVAAEVASNLNGSGNYFSGFNFGGALHSLRVFNRALSASDVSGLLKRGTVDSLGSLLDLDLEWSNPNLSLTIRDRSSNANDGTAAGSGVTQINPIKQLNAERLRVLKNANIGGDSFGTGADKVLGITSGTAPSTSPADMIQIYSADRAATAGKASLHLRTEDGTSHVLGDRVGIGTITPSAPFHNAGASQLDDDVTIAVAKRLKFASGTNQRAGNATLAAGTVTVNNASVTANTVVMLTRKTSGGTIGTAITYTLNAGTSFTINSDNILDTSTFSYLLIEAA